MPPVRLLAPPVPSAATARISSADSEPLFALGACPNTRYDSTLASGIDGSENSFSSGRLAEPPMRAPATTSSTVRVARRSRPGLSTGPPENSSRPRSMSSFWPKISYSPLSTSSAPVARGASGGTCSTTMLPSSRALKPGASMRTSSPSVTRTCAWIAIGVDSACASPTM